MNFLKSLLFLELKLVILSKLCLVFDVHRLVGDESPDYVFRWLSPRDGCNIDVALSHEISFTIETNGH